MAPGSRVETRQDEGRGRARAAPGRQNFCHSVPLSLAVLCVDCEHISAARNSECARCGSKSTIHLSAVLKLMKEEANADAGHQAGPQTSAKGEAA